MHSSDVTKNLTFEFWWDELDLTWPNYSDVVLRGQICSRCVYWYFPPTPCRVSTHIWWARGWTTLSPKNLFLTSLRKRRRRHRPSPLPAKPQLKHLHRQHSLQYWSLHFKIQVFNAIYFSILVTVRGSWKSLCFYGHKAIITVFL